MIILNHINTNRINTMQNYAIWIQIVLSFILKLKMFMKTMTIVIKNLKEKKCVIKGILKFDDYKNCLLNN